MNDMLCMLHMSSWAQEFLYHMWKIHIFGHELILLSIPGTNFCYSNIANIPSNGIGLDFGPVLLSKEILVLINLSLPLIHHDSYKFSEL